MSNQKQNALKDYVEVNVRVERFWEKYPTGRIATEIISWEDGVVVMKASAYKDINDPVPSSTGFAYEKEGSSYINKTSALENCETSAVGRALALMGFEIKKSIASKEEVENAKLNQTNQPELKPTLEGKWKLIGYPLEKFEEWYQGQQSKGHNENQMDAYLTKKLTEVKKGA